MGIYFVNPTEGTLRANSYRLTLAYLGTKKNNLFTKVLGGSANSAKYSLRKKFPFRARDCREEENYLSSRA